MSRTAGTRTFNKEDLIKKVEQLCIKEFGSLRAQGCRGFQVVAIVEDAINELLK